MSDALMRFGGVFLSHNPSELKVVRKKSVGSDGTVREDISTVSGKGEVVGENAVYDLNTLQILERENKVCVLSLPTLGAHPAALTKLVLGARSRALRIEVEFEFSFTAVEEHPDITYEDVYHAYEGENLWDTADYYGADINELVRLNPHISDIRSMKYGEEIRLR